MSILQLSNMVYRHPASKRFIATVSGMHADGDGWAAGPDGTRRWGVWGAAGLFLVAYDTDSVLMQHRAYWTANGGTWGVPGGARDSHETVAQSALREAVEETNIATDRIETVADIVTAGPYPADPERPELPGGWTYTTVIAVTPEQLPVVADEESLELRWVPIPELPKLDLIPPFEEALPLILARYQEWKNHKMTT